MRTAEIQRRWLNYFSQRGHQVVPSASLISPDPSILFTIAGMVPFIPYILGTQRAPWPRAVSVQKCIRTNDIDNVGRTTRHGTFFQMGGNFSFGDYFKEGALEYSWELLTSSQEAGGFGLDGERLWITMWEKDEVSFDYVTKTIGLDEAHVVRLPWEESCWDTGQSGPAGSTAEWHYDRGPQYGPEAFGGKVASWPQDPAAEDRYIEIWNNVFDQFLRGEGRGKNYELVGELEHKAIDTGLGIERLAYLLQGKNNMYEIDQVFPVIETASAMSDHRYGSEVESDVRLRIIGDHVRSAMMLISDGVRPGNDGRGYVLRRLIRRAVRSVRLLGVDERALPSLLPVAKDAMKDAYPELETNFAVISQVAYEEEEAFRRTLTAGTTILDTAVRRARAAGGVVMSGEDAFALHDTYGFPIDLTLEMAAEQGVSVDRERFTELMTAQRERARADALAKKTGHVDVAVYQDFLRQLSGSDTFLGYTDSTATSKVVGIVHDGKPVPLVSGPAEVEIILDATPFYAQAGGQLADRGTINLSGGGLIEVDDVQSPVKGLHVHRGRLIEGTVALDEVAVASIDTERRGAIARAHTATHMIHKALHEFLGEQATQAGSENAPSRLRFDFRNGSAVPASVLSEIDARVNERLADDLAVTDEVMDIEAAKAQGAMALFGEKYGNRVRVVSIGGDWSKELCAGTHVKRSGQLGLVSVLGESSVGSGVRRIDALVGEGAYRQQAKEHVLVNQISSLVGTNSHDELPDRITQVMAKLKTAEKKVAELQQQQLLAQSGQIADGAVMVGDIALAAKDIGNVESADSLRSLVQDVRARLGESKPAVVALFAHINERPLVIIATNEASRNLSVRAGDLVRVASKTLGGGGGGKPQLAQGGGSNVAAIPDALEAVKRELDGLHG